MALTETEVALGEEIIEVGDDQMLLQSSILTNFLFYVIIKY